MEGDLLTLIPVILLFAGAFAVLLWQSVKQWKKPDKEIISDFLLLSASLFASDAAETKTLLRRFLASIAFCAFFLINTHNASIAPYIFCGIALLISGLPLLSALLGWNRSASEERLYRGGALIAVIVGLIGCGFFCFFMGIGTWHGVWWFVCPPGLIFMSHFARPLVAGLRSLCQTKKDPGEKHVRKQKELDPWDRPDRKL